MKKILSVIGALFLVLACSKKNAYPDNTNPSTTDTTTQPATLQPYGVISCTINKKTYIIDGSSIYYGDSDGYIDITGQDKSKGLSFDLLIQHNVPRGDTIQTNVASLLLSGKDFVFECDSASVFLVGKPDSALNGTFSGNSFDWYTGANYPISNGNLVNITKAK